MPIDNESMFTERNVIEQILHDAFYAGIGFTDEDLMQACTAERLALYKDNPHRGYFPKQYQFFILGNLTGKVVCDYACGDGADSVLLVNNGAQKVIAFDISKSAVDIARRRAMLCGLQDRIEVQLDNAEKLNFDSNLFDAIYGSSTLHHLDIERAAKEVHRILKPGGHAVFREPFEQSKFLALMAKLIFAVTPLKPDAVTPQRQLNIVDIAMLRSIFSEVRVRPFGIFNRVDRIIRSETVLIKFNKLDRFLLERFPFLMRYARHIVIECIK